ncbi:MAG: NYN domain-containing protein [Pseudomonadota bacterium]
MLLDQNSRSAVFIDGAHLAHASKAIDLQVDFKKLRDFLVRQTRLMQLTYYIALPDDTHEAPIHRLVDWLDYNGYKIVRKRLKVVDSEDGPRFKGGNLSTSIAVDLLSAGPRIDQVLIFSGDGSLSAAIKALQAKGTRVSVVSTFKGGQQIADGLRRSADRCFELDDIREEIARDASLIEQHV